MSDFKAKMHQNPKFGWALPQTPLGDLTALPQTPSWIQLGLLLTGGEGEGRGGEGKGGEDRGGECCGVPKNLKIDPGELSGARL